MMGWSTNSCARPAWRIAGRKALLGFELDQSVSRRGFRALWPPPQRRARFLFSTFEQPCSALMENSLSLEHVGQVRRFGWIRRHDSAKISCAEPEAHREPEQVDCLFRVGADDVGTKNAVGPRRYWSRYSSRFLSTAPGWRRGSIKTGIRTVDSIFNVPGSRKNLNSIGP